MVERIDGRPKTFDQAGLATYLRFVQNGLTK